MEMENEIENTNPVIGSVWCSLNMSKKMVYDGFKWIEVVKTYCPHCGNEIDK